MATGPSGPKGAMRSHLSIAVGPGCMASMLLCQIQLTLPCVCLLQGFLQDRRKVKTFVQAVDPIVRATDAVAGEAVGMLVELQFDDSKEAVGIFVHKRLSESVGSSTAAFAEAVLEQCTEPGALLASPC